MILRRRGQLLSWLEQNAPTASIRRAVGAGSVEFLGWFEEIPGSKYPGWIVRATCPITGKVWKIVVRLYHGYVPPYLNYTHFVWVLDEDIPWQHWNPTDSENPFTYGDHPEIYEKNKTNTK